MHTTATTFAAVPPSVRSAVEAHRRALCDRYNARAPFPRFDADTAVLRGLIREATAWLDANPMPTDLLRVQVWDGETAWSQFVAGRASTREEAESLVQGSWPVTHLGGGTELTQIDSRVGDETVEELIWLVMVDVEDAAR
jgi:hypothetical protein